LWKTSSFLLYKTYCNSQNVTHNKKRMTTSLLSPKYQIVIPKEVRETLNLKPGQRLSVSAKDGHIEIAPILTPDQLIGFLSDCADIPFEREPDRDPS